mmetsp:Transcript_4455/g.10492  ORF Transcript_4455/g.10492 Transcript_4455/m.10492 type:complete len:201 (-) Transcript_4455:887-1489(-)
MMTTMSVMPTSVVSVMHSMSMMVRTLPSWSKTTKTTKTSTTSTAATAKGRSKRCQKVHECKWPGMKTRDAKRGRRTPTMRLDLVEVLFLVLIELVVASVAEVVVRVDKLPTISNNRVVGVTLVADDAVMNLRSQSAYTALDHAADSLQKTRDRHVEFAIADETLQIEHDVENNRSKDVRWNEIQERLGERKETLHQWMIL